MHRYGHPLAALSLMGLNIGTLALSFFALKMWGDVMMTLILIRGWRSMSASHG